jgi:hypothetical protein
MTHRSRPLSFRRRTPAFLMILIAAMGYRRWLSRPWQWTIRDCMIAISGCAAGLVLLSFPPPMAVFLLVLALAVFVSLRLPRHGFPLADVAVLLALILVTAVLLLPAMERTRDRTFGKRFFPLAVPQKYVTLLYGSD